MKKVLPWLPCGYKINYILRSHVYQDCISILYAVSSLHVPAAIAPEIELLELHEQWNDHNKYVIDKFIRFDAVYYIPLHDTTIPSIIKAAKIFAGYGD